MNNVVQKVAISVISASISAATTYVVTRHILNKRNDQNTAEIHNYYQNIVKEYKFSQKRLKAMEQVINSQGNSDALFELVNDILKKMDEEEDISDEDEDHSQDVDGVKSEKEMGQALNDLGREMQTKLKTPYHQYYQTHDQNVDPNQKEMYESLIRGTEPPIDMSNHQKSNDIPEDAIGKTEDEYMEDQWAHMSGSPVRTVGDAMTPYIISQNECGSEWCDVECLIYYDGDGVLANEHDEALIIEDYLGSDELLNHFVDGLLYVRNERFGMDYEIRWDEGSFAENVAGLKFDDVYPKGVTKRNGRRRLEDYD